LVLLGTAALEVLRGGVFVALAAEVLVVPGELVLLVVPQYDAVELQQAIGGVGDGVCVGVGRAGEPIPGLAAAPGAQQGVGVRVPQARHPGLRRVGGELTDLQHRYGGVVLAEVRPRAGGDDQQFDRLEAIERVPVGAAVEVDGALGPAERPLTVGEHGQVRPPARHPVVRPQLGDRGLPLAGVVRREPHRLPHRGDP
jgi:hypothetical protein